MQQFRQVSPDRIHIVYNSIDPNRFTVADPAAVRAETRLKYGLAADAHVGLFVGHNFWLKGLQPLLEALAKRQATQPAAERVHLLVSGGGKIMPFQKMAEQLGLGQTVQLLGFTPDVKSLFHAADFFVSPTYYDPCSLVVMEALACRLPVITTACNGAGELVTNGREGFVVPTPNHQAELINALNAMTDVQARRAMAEAAQKLGQAQTFDNHVNQLERIFAAVAAEKLAGTRPAPHFGLSATRNTNTTPSFQSTPGKESGRATR